ncbi:MAG: alpha/beta fold hydrolase [Dehalococcoidia bacterium]|nr:alpha/beta fold hydrolase [Dehalococcoidia bacterium]
MTTVLEPPLLPVGPVPWWLRGRHLETILPSFRGPWHVPFDSVRHLVEVGPGSAVETWDTPARVARPRGSVLVVHGLGGSADRPHVRAITAAALHDGWHAVRVNLRTHGGTAALSSTLFNAAQSDDIGAVLADMEARGLPRPYAVLGISLGANMVLRYAALAGDACRADAVATLNPAIDFFRIEQEILRPSNLLYRYNFVLGLCRMLNEVRALRTVPGPPASAWRIRTVRTFDGHFTAPAGGYTSVDEYYADAGAGTVLEGVRVPALLVTAVNDPFVPADIVTPHHGAAGGRVQVRLAARGGHVGYRVTGEDGRPAFWAAQPLLAWTREILRT